MKTYKIGTRGSLLAVTQCTLIAEEMTKRTGANFELVKIKTQGDAQTEKPLWQMDGKDFFTKELDQALLSNEVDLVVHSYKDLGSERPDGIELVSITQRKYANDILLLKKETITDIQNKKIFNVGTSSPRRIINTQTYLKDYLPKASQALEVSCSMLRGNVNTRIQKLKDGSYDAIVLALAGLERLASKKESLEELKSLLEGLTFMVMPQKIFPSSASQGALAIEYNANKADKELYKVLKSVHCDQTQKEVKNERALFKSYGGGCHLAVGINTQTHKNFLLDIERGSHNEKKIDKITLHGVDYSSIENLTTLLPIGDNDQLIKKEKIDISLKDNSIYFVTSKYCIHAVENLRDSVIFASGARTMKKLAAKGLWVHGSADSLGHEQIVKMSESKALKLMLPNKSVTVLSHDQATSPIGDTTPCYKRIVTQAPDDLIENVKKAEAFYCSSFFQYEQYVKVFPALRKAKVLCGLGKTFDSFQKHNIPVTPFASMKQLKEMTNII